MDRGQLITLTRLLARLEGQAPLQADSGADFKARVARILDRYGCSEAPSQPDLSDEEQRQKRLLRYALGMAEITYGRILEPPPQPDPAVLERLVQGLGAPPDSSDEFSQSSVDPASSLRRALTMHAHLGGSGSVLALGDDDATSIALALLGSYQITAVDIDRRILDWLEAGAARLGLSLQTRVVDLRRLPDEMRSGYRAVVTDPAADRDFSREFVAAARACAHSEGWVFFCGHPFWNSGFTALRDYARGLGLREVELKEHWHSYTPVVYNDSTAHYFAIEPRWFHRLARTIRIWSHFVVTRVEH